MTKKVRQQIDISNIFIEATNDAASKAEIQRLDVWPILVAIHVMSDNKAKIHKLSYPTVNNFDHYQVHMMTDMGQSIACVTRGADRTFSVFSADRPYHGGESYMNGYCFTPRIESKNPRYVVRNLAKSSNHEVYNRINAAISRAAVGLNEVMRGLLEDSFYTMSGKQLYRLMPEVPDRNGNYVLLLRHFMGEVKREEFSLDTQLSLHSDHKKWLEQSDALRSALERVNAVFSHDKWLVLPRVNGGAIVGAVSFHPMQSALREAVNSNNGCFPYADSFNYVQEVVPFKWYKSLDSVPEDILAELNISALLLKAHMGSEELFPLVVRDKVYEDIEAVAYKAYDLSTYLFNK